MTREQALAREELKALGVRLGRPHLELWQRALGKRRARVRGRERDRLYYEANRELRARYRRADLNVEAMRAILEERFT